MGKRQAKVFLPTLRQLKSSPLDKLTPQLLAKNKWQTIIVNGFYPERVEEVLIGKKEVVCTEIIHREIIKTTNFQKNFI